MITTRFTRQLTIVLMLLAAFALRVYRLDAQSLRGDEAATVLYAALPLTDLWELSRITDPHPPLFYALLHPWQWLLSDEAWVMRFVGVITGTLAVAALYRLARVSLHQRSVSLPAAALLALNPLQIWLAQDIRSYPLFTLLGLLSSWALWTALTGTQGGRGAGVQGRKDAEMQGRRGAGVQGYRGARAQTDSPHAIRHSPFTIHNSQFLAWLIYILLTVASLYTHYYTVFLIAFQGIFALANAKRFWYQKWPWLASQIAIGILIIPGLLLAANFIGGEAGGGVAVIGLAEILRRTAAALLTGFTINASWSLWLSLILLPIWIIGLVALLRHNFTSGSFWALFFAVPTLGVILLAIDRPFFKERFLIQAQPAFMVLLSMGLLSILNASGWHLTGRKKEKRRGGLQRPRPAARFGLRIFALLALALLLPANLAAIVNYHTDPTYAKAPPWRLYHEFVRDQANPDDVMLTNFPEAAVSYYSPDGVPFYVVPAERGQTTAELEEQTAQIAGTYERIWFLPMLHDGLRRAGAMCSTGSIAMPTELTRFSFRNLTSICTSVRPPLPGKCKPNRPNLRTASTCAATRFSTSAADRGWTPTPVRRSSR